MDKNAIRISVITPTGARPEAQIICRTLFERQTILRDSRFDVEWIVVDDSRDVFNWGDRATIVSKPTPSWEDIQENTQGRNLLRGLELSTGEYLAVFEDDDYYSPDYLLKMALTLIESGGDIIGESRAFYYNLKTLRYKELSNQTHASLCQTMFCRSEVSKLERIIKEQRTKFFDIMLWEEAAHAVLFPSSTLATGIKGLPGRGGIGIGHLQNNDWPCDSELAILKSRLGKDIDLYKDLICTTTL